MGNDFGIRKERQSRFRIFAKGIARLPTLGDTERTHRERRGVSTWRGGQKTYKFNTITLYCIEKGLKQLKRAEFWLNIKPSKRWNRRYRQGFSIDKDLEIKSPGKTARIKPIFFIKPIYK